MCDNGRRESRGIIGAGNREIQAPIARLVFRAQTRPALAKNERSLPHLAFGNHAAADARCGGRALLQQLSPAVPGHAGAGARTGGSRSQPLGRPRARRRAKAVLSHWAGLGYYSRARNLLRAAQEIDARHGGRFPSEYDAALALPGIGRYTAAAVLSIAYDQPLAVLDGNVARVLARLGALRGDLRAPALWRKLEATAQDLLARRTPGDWNQAMMELGATVCVPKSPKCGECPVAKWCRARKLGIEEQLRDARKKRAAVKVTLAAAVLMDPRGRTLLVRQAGNDGALFSRMWQFPALETRSDAASGLADYLRRTFKLKVADEQLIQL